MSIQIESPGLQLNDSQIVQLADDAMRWQSRIKSKEAHVDLWGKDKRKLPSGAILILCHEITNPILDLYQIIWFNRIDNNDELWVLTEEEAWHLVERHNCAEPESWAAFLSEISSTCSCVYSVPQSHSIDESMIELLANWFVGGAGSPKSAEHLIACNYVSKEHYRILLGRVQNAVGQRQKQHERIVTRTLERETEIVQIARVLELNPEPSGRGLTQWKAICPSAAHGLYISTHDDQFFCGYCGIAGGIDELREFVKEQKQEKQQRTQKRPSAGVAKQRHCDEDVIRVVYGINLFDVGQLIAIKESEAIRRATNIDVLHTARTWAEVKARLTSEDFVRLCEDFDGDDVFFDSDGRVLEEPPGETVFDRKFIKSEYGFDRWYIDPLADMRKWIPVDIQEHHGEISSGGMFVDPGLVLNPKFEDQIRRELAAHGYWAVRDDDLVMATIEWHEGRLESILRRLGG